MALVTWTTGATISKTNLDAVARQVLITCTSTTRPASPDEGMSIYETDTDRILIWTGSTWLIVCEPWQTFTPTLNGATLDPTLGSGSTATSRYQRSYGLVTYQGIVQFGTSGTAAGTGDYTISLPVTAAVGITARHLGVANAWDNSAAHTCITTALLNTSTTMKFAFANSWPMGNVNYIGAAQPMTWAANDQLFWTVSYEAA